MIEKKYNFKKLKYLIGNYWNSIDICFVIKFLLIFLCLFIDIVRERYFLFFMEIRKFKRIKEIVLF